MVNNYQFPYSKTIREDGEVVLAADHNKQENQAECLTDAIGNYDFLAGSVEARFVAINADVVVIQGDIVALDTRVTALETASLVLDDLSDVDTTGVLDGDTLVFNVATGWTTTATIGAETLAGTLALGNITSGNDVIFSNGDSIAGLGDLIVEATMAGDGDLIFGSHGGTITLNETGDETLLATSFTATSIIGALNELVTTDGLTLAETLALGADANDIAITGLTTLDSAGALGISPATATATNIGPAAGGHTVTFNGTTDASILNGAITAKSITSGTLQAPDNSQLNVTGGDNLAGAGRLAWLAGGDGTSNGGDCLAYGGNSTSSGNGGSSTLGGGTAKGAAGNGGDVNVIGAPGTGTGEGGRVWLLTGNGGATGDSGTIDLNVGSAAGGTLGAINIGTVRATSVNFGPAAGGQTVTFNGTTDATILNGNINAPEFRLGTGTDSGLTRWGTSQIAIGDSGNADAFVFAGAFLGYPDGLGSFTALGAEIGLGSAIEVVWSNGTYAALDPWDASTNTTFMGQSAAGVVYIGATTGTGDGQLNVQSVNAAANDFAIECADTTRLLVDSLGGVTMGDVAGATYGPAVGDLVVTNGTTELLYTGADSTLYVGAYGNAGNIDFGFDTNINRQAAGTVGIGTAAGNALGSLNLASISASSGDLTLGARGSTITLNEAGDESLSTTSFTATSIIGALNELVAAGGGSETLTETLVLGNITSGNDIIVTDDDTLLFGTGSDVSLEFDTAQTTDMLVLGLDSTSMTLLIIDKADSATNFAAPGSSNPTIRIQSNDSGAPGDALLLYHDATEAVIDTDATGLAFKAGGTSVCFIDATAARLTFIDDKHLAFGSSNDAQIEWNTAQSNDTLVIGTDSTSRTILIIDKADDATDFGAGNATNPTLRIQSADQAQTTDYVSWEHDQTDAHGRSGAGAFALTPASGEFRVNSVANAAGASIKSATAVHALAAAATSTETGIIPAGVKVLFVTCRVQVAVTTSSAGNTFDVGDSGDPDLWGATIAGAAGTRVDHTDATADPEGTWSASARDVVFDAVAAETFTAGSIRLTVFYVDATAPTT